LLAHVPNRLIRWLFINIGPLSDRRLFMKRPNPLPPDRMTPTAHLAELADILALGILRLRARRKPRETNDVSEFRLDCSPDRSGHGRTSRTRRKRP
jgi:hypothetical protein